MMPLKFICIERAQTRLFGVLTKQQQLEEGEKCR